MIHDEDTFLVKLSRQGESVLFIGTEEEAKAFANEKNEEYQTDEYYVEQFSNQKFRWPTTI